MSNEPVFCKAAMIVLYHCLFNVFLSGDDLFRTYRSSGKDLTSIIDILSSGDLASVDLADQPLQTVAGVIKKYLRELPEPVIPTAFYKQFVEASSMFNDISSAH